MIIAGNAQLQQRLDETEFVVSDLSGLVLGHTRGTTVWIDVSAAGHGWFVDRTPLDDHEFITLPGVTDASVSPSGMDLLTVVSHELGHLLGFEHSDDGLMNSTLAPGVRLTPLDMADPDPIQDSHLESNSASRRTRRLEAHELRLSDTLARLGPALAGYIRRASHTRTTLSSLRLVHEIAAPFNETQRFRDLGRLLAKGQSWKLTELEPEDVALAV